jgi:probable F420-dependent oxidoreductase
VVRVSMLLVAVARPIRPSVRVAGLGAQLLLDRARVRRGAAVPVELHIHGSTIREDGDTQLVRVGVVFPQLEIGTDPAKIRAYAQAAEDLGYTHLVAFDHVLGADTSTRPDWRGPYNAKSTFHEVFVLFGFLAACTTRLELAPAVVILPQRQIALVAKQAAEVDVLTRGRTRLGVGLGWNEVEYVALGEKFRNRARRIEEQIALLRLLFTNEVVDFTGRWHRIDRAGLNPLPVQRPIPIWMGGNAEPAMRRIARIADGWFTHVQPDDAGREPRAAFPSYLRDAGRDPATFPIEGRVAAAKRTPDDWAAVAQGFAEMGATHLEFSTMGAGCATVDDHIALIRRFRETAPVFGGRSPTA